MRTTTTKRWKRWVTAAVGVAVILIATAAKAPVLAHGAGQRGEHPRQDRWRRGERPAPHVRHVVVPKRIRPREARIYRPYYRGRVYHPRHRHAHAVYYFPVRTPYGVVHLPHDYCDGRLFVDGYVAYHGERFGFVIGF